VGFGADGWKVKEAVRLSASLAYSKSSNSSSDMASDNNKLNEQHAGDLPGIRHTHIWKEAAPKKETKLNRAETDFCSVYQSRTRKKMVEMSWRGLPAVGS
jgi:hypothetical protein